MQPRDILEAKTLDLLDSASFRYILMQSKRDLYIDYDGVIMATHEITSKELNLLLLNRKKQDSLNDTLQEENYYHIKLHKENNIHEDILKDYFINRDWHDLLAKTREINDSKKTIRFLKSLEIFRNIAVATNSCTYLNEGAAKQESLKELSIPVFIIPRKLKKSQALKAYNNILVDDTLNKVLDWQVQGGIGVLFQENYQGMKLPTANEPYFIINNLLDVLKVNFFVEYYNILLEHDNLVKDKQKRYEKTRE